MIYLTFILNFLIFLKKSKFFTNYFHTPKDIFIPQKIFLVFLLKNNYITLNIIFLINFNKNGFNNAIVIKPNKKYDAIINNIFSSNVDIC